MKHLRHTLACALLLAMSAQAGAETPGTYGHQVKDDAVQVGDKAAQVGRDTYHGVVNAAKVVGHETASAAKRGYHAAASAAKQGYHAARGAIHKATD